MDKQRLAEMRAAARSWRYFPSIRDKLPELLNDGATEIERLQAALAAERERAEKIRGIMARLWSEIELAEGYGLYAVPSYLLDRLQNAIGDPADDNPDPQA